MDALPPPADSPDPENDVNPDAIRAIERRIARADDPRDIVLWTQIRGEIVRQNEDALDRRHGRQQQIEAARSEIAKGFLAVSLGFILILYGYWVPGFLCLGAGLYSLAPDYVKEFTPRRQPREADDDKK